LSRGTFQHLLLAIDQFEDLWVNCTANARQAFLSELGALLKSGQSVSVVAV